MSFDAPVIRRRHMLLGSIYHRHTRQQPRRQMTIRYWRAILFVVTRYGVGLMHEGLANNIEY